MTFRQALVPLGTRRLTACVLVVSAVWAAAFIHHAKFASNPLQYEEAAIATHLARHHGFASPFRADAVAPLSSWSPPLYPFLASKVLRALGDDTLRSRRALLGVNALLYGCVAAGLFAVAARLFGRASAGVGVVLFLCNPFVLQGLGRAWDTYLSLATFVWLLAAAIAVRRSRWGAGARLAAFAALGVGVGFLCLANAAYLVAAIAPIWIAAAGQRLRPALASAVVAVAGFTLVIAPWTVRNAAVFDRLIFVRGNAAFELWFSNRPETTGWLTPDSFTIGHPSMDATERRLVLRIGEARYADVCAERFRALVRADPAAFVARCVYRAAYLFIGDPTQPSYAPGVPTGKVHGIVWGTLVGRGIFVTLGLAGSWLGWRLGLRTSWVVVPALLAVAPFLVSSVWDKQIVPLQALLCVPAGVLVAGVWVYVRRGAWPVDASWRVPPPVAWPRVPPRVRDWWDGFGAPAFNRRCLEAGFIWLAVTIPLGIQLRPTEPDFGQFYVGAQVLRHGAWDGLYPISRDDSLMNPGLKADSYIKPAWRDLEKRYGVPTNTRFILPPTSTFVFFPLALLSFHAAFWLFTAASSLCVLVVGWQASRSLRFMLGRETRWGGLLILLIAFSPMTARAIRIANTTPFIAVAIGAIVFSTLRSERWGRAARVAFYVVAGGLMKYATFVLLPLLLVARRWRTLALAATFGALTLAAGYAVAGRATFATFSRDVAPKLDRIPFFYGNQSIPGYLVRSNDLDSRLPLKFRIPLAIGRGGVLAMVGGLILLRRRDDWRRPEMTFAAAVALISWMMLYGPIMWEHYPIFTAPFWGWLLWEARNPGGKRWLVATALVLVNIPAGIFHVAGFFVHPLLLPEILNCTQMYAVIMLLGIATARLAEPSPRTVRTEAHRNATGERRMAVALTA